MPKTIILQLNLPQVLQRLSILPSIQRQRIDPSEMEHVPATHVKAAGKEAPDAALGAEVVAHAALVEAIICDAGLLVGRREDRQGRLWVGSGKDHARLVADGAVTFCENRVAGGVGVLEVQLHAVCYGFAVA